MDCTPVTAVRFIEKAGGHNGREVFLADVILVTAPAVISKMLKRCAHASDTAFFIANAPLFRAVKEIKRIQMNVMQDILELRVIFNQDFLRAALEQGSAPLIFLIVIFCESDIQFP